MLCYIHTNKWLPICFLDPCIIFRTTVIDQISFFFLDTRVKHPNRFKSIIMEIFYQRLWISKTFLKILVIIWHYNSINISFICPSLNIETKLMSFLLVKPLPTPNKNPNPLLKYNELVNKGSFKQSTCLVKCETAKAIHVVNIHPYNITWYALLSKSSGNLQIYKAQKPERIYNVK